MLIFDYSGLARWKAVANFLIYNIYDEQQKNIAGQGKTWQGNVKGKAKQSKTMLDLPVVGHG